MATFYKLLFDLSLYYTLTGFYLRCVSGKAPSAACFLALTACAAVAVFLLRVRERGNKRRQDYRRGAVVVATIRRNGRAPENLGGISREIIGIYTGVFYQASYSHSRERVGGKPFVLDRPQLDAQERRERVPVDSERAAYRFKRRQRRDWVRRRRRLYRARVIIRRCFRVLSRAPAFSSFASLVHVRFSFR